MAKACVAKILLETAQEDARAMSALCLATEIGDATIGFHAQQTAEKAIKAVLSAQGIAFRRTHDLAELLDLLADEKIALPPHSDCLDGLNPYAIEARYGLIGPSVLDRKHWQTVIGAVLACATASVDGQAGGRITRNSITG